MRLITLADAAARGRDNFLALRHVAAAMVIYGHSYALAANPAGAQDVVARLLPGFYAGNLAVYVFFAISGYLVTGSLLRDDSVLRYVRNRLLRVYPAYFVCLIVSVGVIGAAFTTLPLAEYLMHPQTRSYLLQNLQPVTLAWTLPGVFADNPRTDVVNGTLWSLSLELRWYVYLGVLAALTLVRRRWAFTTVAGGLVLFGAWEWWIGKPDTSEYRALSQTFLIAALAAHWRERIALSGWLLAPLLAAIALAGDARASGPLVVAAVIYATWWIAYRLPAPRWPGGHDLSYGLFLYGFPVQQSLMALWPQITPLALLAAALPLAAMLAAASWFAVERPALRWKATPRREPLPAV